MSAQNTRPNDKQKDSPSPSSSRRHTQSESNSESDHAAAEPQHVSKEQSLYAKEHLVKSTMRYLAFRTASRQSQGAHPSARRCQGEMEGRSFERIIPRGA